MHIVLPLLYVAVFVYIIYKHPAFAKLHIPLWVLLVVFFLKIIASGVLLWLYTYYYPNRIEADIFKYYDDALVIYSSLHDSVWHFSRFITGIDISNPALDVYFDDMQFWDRKIDYGVGNDNRTIIRVNALVMLFSFGNIWVHNVFASFASLLAYLMIFSVFKQQLQQYNYVLFAAVVLIPSSIFWTAALLKETLVMCGAACFIWALHRFVTHGMRVSYVLIYLLGLYILLQIKIYVLVALVPAAISFYIAGTVSRFRVSHIYLFIYGLSILGVVLNHTLIQAVPFLETFAYKRNDFIMDAAYYAHAKSYIPIGFLGTSLIDFIQETPHALYRAICLPWIWDVRSFLDVLPAAENLLGIILLCVSIMYPKRQSRGAANLIWFSALFSLAVFWMVGITTPVVGAIVRYNVPILPFLYSTFVLLIDWNKLTGLKKYGTDLF